MNWFKKLFLESSVEYLEIDWCNGKTNKELLDKLKYGCISPGSGNMIVAELLERLVKIMGSK